MASGQSGAVALSADRWLRRRAKGAGSTGATRRSYPGNQVIGASFWVVIAALAVVETGIVVAALRMRTTNRSDALVGTRAAEAVWTLLPALLLVALAFFSYRWLES